VISTLLAGLFWLCAALVVGWVAVCLWALLFAKPAAFEADEFNPYRGVE
jgi:hypothetical protein